ncbi:MAG TPA: serine/threonine-protein kinase [Polyangiaceae bacterium]|nr:serine/threonine-protein kinase [Polyangiaceae bacterium]
MRPGEGSNYGPGAVLGGKYRVERVLGQGGMGVVVAARHIQLQELVAIKLLLPSALENPEMRGRFLREARAAAKIRSEHVARVVDVGQLDDGAPYMVMEYLAGRDLSAALAAHGRFAIENAVDYLAQACEAIAEAHALGIIHRDLKPANLMLVVRSDGSECVKVLDFGISKKTDNEPGSELSMTATDMIFGSPLYMSPEQMTSARSVDGRTDIWALGTILHELLAGTTPFQADNLAALAIQVATEQPPLLHTLRSDVPEGLSHVVQRCLQKQRGARFADVGELALSLLPFAPERAVPSLRRAAAILRGPQASAALASAPAVAPAAAATPAPGTAPSAVRPVAGTVVDPLLTGRGWAHTTTRKRSGTAVISVVAVGLLLSVLVGVWLKLRAGAPSPAAAASPTAALAVTSAVQTQPAAPTATALQAVRAAPATDAPAPSAELAKPAMSARPDPSVKAAHPVAPKKPGRPEAAPPASKRNVYDDL